MRLASMSIAGDLVAIAAALGEPPRIQTVRVDRASLALSSVDWIPPYFLAGTILTRGSAA